MSETAPLTWACPVCGRRVPRRIERCHCGRLRDAAGPAPEAPALRPRPVPSGPATLAIWRSSSLDVKALIVLGALIVTGGIGWGLFGSQPAERRPALLGYIDRPAPLPARAPQPPFKLPWWR